MNDVMIFFQEKRIGKTTFDFRRKFDPVGDQQTEAQSHCGNDQCNRKTQVQ